MLDFAIAAPEPVAAATSSRRTSPNRRARAADGIAGRYGASVEVTVSGARHSLSCDRRTAPADAPDDGPESGACTTECRCRRRSGTQLYARSHDALTPDSISVAPPRRPGDGRRRRPRARPRRRRHRFLPASAAGSEPSFGERLMLIDALAMRPFQPRRCSRSCREAGVTCVTSTLGFWETAIEAMDAVAWWRDLARENADIMSIARTSGGHRSALDAAGQHRRRAWLPERRRCSTAASASSSCSPTWACASCSSPTTTRTISAEAATRPNDSGLSRFGTRAGARDEPHGHPGRPLACRQSHHARRDQAFEEAGRGHACQPALGVSAQAQQDRRCDPRAEGQRRRHRLRLLSQHHRRRILRDRGQMVRDGREDCRSSPASITSASAPIAATTTAPPTTTGCARAAGPAASTMARARQRGLARRRRPTG